MQLMGNISATVETEVCTGTRDGKTEKAMKQNRRRGIWLTTGSGKRTHAPDLHFYTQPASDCGSVNHNPICSFIYFLYECVLLTCLAILCRHIDEVQNTWRQCHGKGCPGLSASWAEEAEENMLLLSNVAGKIHHTEQSVNHKHKSCRGVENLYGKETAVYNCTASQECKLAEKEDFMRIFWEFTIGHKRLISQQWNINIRLQFTIKCTVNQEWSRNVRSNKYNQHLSKWSKKIRGWRKKQQLLSISTTSLLSCGLGQWLPWYLYLHRWFHCWWKKCALTFSKIIQYPKATLDFAGYKSTISLTQSMMYFSLSFIPLAERTRAGYHSHLKIKQLYMNLVLVPSLKKDSF